MATNDDYLNGRYAPNWRAEAARAEEERRRRQQDLQAPMVPSTSYSPSTYKSPEEQFKNAAPAIRGIGGLYLFFDFLLIIFMITSCQLSYTHISGSNCLNSDHHFALFNATDFDYYIQPFNGVCEQKSTLKSGKCIEWSNSSFWEEFAIFSNDDVDGAQERARYADVAYYNLIVACWIFCAITVTFHLCQLCIPVANAFSCIFGLLFYIFCIATFKLFQDCANRNQAIGYAENWETFYDCEEVKSSRMEGARLAAACIAFGSFGMIISIANMCALGANK
jgi:hypothetical protein